jgi:hypothetical protein
VSFPKAEKYQDFKDKRLLEPKLRSDIIERHLVLLIVLVNNKKKIYNLHVYLAGWT